MDALTMIVGAVALVAVGAAVVLALRGLGAAGARQDGLNRAVDGVAQAQAALTGLTSRSSQSAQPPAAAAAPRARA